MQINLEGFEQSDEQRLASKLQNKNNPNELGSTFFVLPQAKPLLSKTIIDIEKPKVLIKQIEIYLEPPELLTNNLHKDLFSTDKPHNSKAPSIKNLDLTTIWDKYVMSQTYSILYIKYYRQEIQEIQKRGHKKFKLQMQKLCRNQTYLFSTYIVDLSFLSDIGNYLLRNLKQISFQEMLSQPCQQDIKFDSRFQGGNLFAVFQKKNIIPNFQQYDLILQNDINSKGFSNWFYFSVRCKKRTTIKFNIVNMQKTHSLYNQGMKAAVFSHQKHQRQKVEWHHDGYAYCYYRNELRKNNQNDYTYNTLTFCYDVKYENDIVYIAASLPYSYSKMLKFIDSIEKVAKLNTNIYFKKQSVGSSISSNICPIITLTWKRDKRKDQKRKKKKIIGVIARQHPCETVSSYIMEGFINSLVHLSSQSAVQLLQSYIFKIVPMTNVDGVIYGNSRCDITGNDVNRKWTRNPNKFIYPIISGIKNIFGRLIQDQYEIDYFIDLHGHSRKLGSFLYGCKFAEDDLQSRQTAWILSRLNSKIIFQECQFGLSQIKKQTARGIMSDLVIRKKSMTLQTSFYGYRHLSGIKHWQIRDLQKIGSTFIEGIYAQVTKDPKLFNWETLRAELKQTIQKQKLSGIKKTMKENSQSSFGSDSNPSQDEMTDKQKAQHFLDPTVASKIGLNEVRVFRKQQKSRQKIQNKQEQKREKYQMIVDGFKQKIQLMLPRKPQSLKIINDEAKNVNSSKQAHLLSRYSKSTTKILPFKFAQRLQKPSSLQKRSLKSVQIVIKRSQKLSMPNIQLPKVENKNNFWSSLKKEFEVLLTERKTKDIL